MENKIYKCIKCGKDLNAETFKNNKSYCDECNENLKLPLQIENLNQSSLLDFNLLDLECKHVLNFDYRKAKKIITKAEKAHYPNIFWGYYRNGTVKSEWEIINKMIDNYWKKAIRITITSDKKVWCDNTHSLLSYIQRGCVKLKDIPFYIVDFSKDKDVAYVFNYENSLDPDFDEIKNAVKNAKRLEFFIQNKGRKNISWTIKDLYNQLTKAKEALK